MVGVVVGVRARSGCVSRSSTRCLEVVHAAAQLVDVGGRLVGRRPRRPSGARRASRRRRRWAGRPRCALEVVDAAVQLASGPGRAGGGRCVLPARRRPCSPGSARSRRARLRPPPTRRRRAASAAALRRSSGGRRAGRPRRRAPRRRAGGWRGRGGSRIKRPPEVLLPRRGDRRRGHVDEDRRVRRLRLARRAPCSPAAAAGRPCAGCRARSR